jgi:hypothetical protein
MPEAGMKEENGLSNISALYLGAQSQFVAIAREG